MPVPQRGGGPPAPVPAKRGPLLGKRVAILIAPTECDGHAVRQLDRRLARLGVTCMHVAETPGEARGEHREPVAIHRLLVEVGVADFDALVVMGGSGATRVAEDAAARALVERFQCAGKPVGGVGAGRLVLARAGVAGLRHLGVEAMVDDFRGGDLLPGDSRGPSRLSGALGLPCPALAPAPSTARRVLDSPVLS